MEKLCAQAAGSTFPQAPVTTPPPRDTASPFPPATQEGSALHGSPRCPDLPGQKDPASELQGQREKPPYRLCSEFWKEKFDT